jgi:hypothetical protein
MRPVVSPTHRSSGPLPLQARPSFLPTRIVTMAFAVRNLSVLAYANGFTLWHYKAGRDRLETVSGGNYLADAADMLAVGDMVMVSAADGARILCVALSDIETVVTAPLA